VQDYPPSPGLSCFIERGIYLPCVAFQTHLKDKKVRKLLRLLAGELAVPKKNLDGPAYLARSEGPFTFLGHQLPTGPKGIID
jgi:hypothetical protein